MDGDSSVIVRKLSAHSQLSAQSKADLSAFLTKPFSYPPGATIAGVGDPADLITLIQDGYACRCASLNDGRRQIHGLLIPGDAADLEATLLKRRTDNIVALTATSVWLVPKSRLASFPHVDASLTEALAREAVIAGEIARQWIVNLGRRSAHHRLAHLLCEISTRLQAIAIDVEDDYIVPLRQQDLADAAGISMVHANRVFQSFKAEGSVEVTSRGFRILDLRPLQKTASFDPAYLHLRVLH